MSTTSSEVRVTHADGTITYQQPYTLDEVMQIQTTRRFNKGVGIAAGFDGFTHSRKRGKDAGNDSSVPKRSSDDEKGTGTQRQSRGK